MTRHETLPAGFFASMDQHSAAFAKPADDLRSTQLADELESSMQPDRLGQGLPTETPQTPSMEKAAALRARPFRPAYRPTMAILQVLDDNQATGELVRIRGDQCIIGRDTGDVRIPHDTLISNPHLEIMRRLEDGHHNWYLRDLESTNGTYVRALRIRFRDQEEIVIGRRRLRYVDASHSGDDGPQVAKLVEITSQGAGHEIPLLGDEVWLGRALPHCPRFLTDDDCLDPLHARLYRDSAGHWCLKDANSINGVLVRVNEVRLIHNAGFQAGEQRFRVFFP